MRDEDVIGIDRQPGTRPLRFLKTEAKSRANLAASVVAEAARLSTKTTACRRRTPLRSCPSG